MQSPPSVDDDRLPAAVVRRAAERLGIELVFATDRCHQLDDPWRDGAIPVRFHDERRRSRRSSRRAATADRRGDRGRRSAGDAGGARRRALGLPGNPPARPRASAQQAEAAASASRGGLAVPWFFDVAGDGDPASRGARDPRVTSLRRQAARAVGQPRRDPRGLARASSRRRSSASARCWRAPRCAGAAHRARRRAGRGLHRRARVSRSKGVLTDGDAAGPRGLRQAGSARWPVLRGNDLRHAVALGATSQQRWSSTMSARDRCARPAARARSTPSAASARRCLSCWKSRRGRSAGSARGCCGSSRTAQVSLEEVLLRHALGEDVSAYDARDARRRR